MEGLARIISKIPQTQNYELEIENQWFKRRELAVLSELSQAQTGLNASPSVPAVFSRRPLQYFPLVRRLWEKVSRTLKAEWASFGQKILNALSALLEFEKSNSQRFARHGKQLSSLESRLEMAEIQIGRLEKLSRRPPVEREASPIASKGSFGNFEDQGAAKGAASAADSQALDQFYIALEERFRGSQKTVQKRLAVYLPMVHRILHDCESRQVIDIGCGRGDWLQLLKSEGIEGVGVEVNPIAQSQGEAAGLKIVVQDALDYLKGLSDNSVAVITGFHIVEHLPFPVLLQLFDLCCLKLAPRGVLIFETPNSRNLSVAANTFYIDPTHSRPLPPELLEFIAEYSGFGDVSLMFLNQDASDEGHNTQRISKQSLTEFVDSQFARDFAVIGRKR